MTVVSQVRARLDDDSGFGLVETLIALTILVIGLVAVSGLSLTSADQARIANWRSQQAAVAPNGARRRAERGLGRGSQ